MDFGSREVGAILDRGNRFRASMYKSVSEMYIMQENGFTKSMN